MKKLSTDAEDDNSSLLLKLVKKRNVFLSHFQSSERTKATTETNNTSKESSEAHLLGPLTVKSIFFAVMKIEYAL